MNAFSDALYEVFSCAAETYNAKGLRNLLADKAALHQCKRGMLALGPMRGFSLRLYRKSLQWSQSRLLFPGPNGAPLGRAALHNALRRLKAVGERSSIGPITPEKIRAAFLGGDPLQ